MAGRAALQTHIQQIHAQLVLVVVVEGLQLNRSDRLQVQRPIP